MLRYNKIGFPAWIYPEKKEECLSETVSIVSIINFDNFNSIIWIESFSQILLFDLNNAQQ